MDGLPPLPSMTKTVGDVMRVIRVLDPSSDAVSFTLLDEHGAVSPAERYCGIWPEDEPTPRSLDGLGAHGRGSRRTSTCRSASWSPTGDRAY